MSVFVLYHSNCFDGFGAKYAAWKKFGDNAQYTAVNYGQPLPKALDDVGFHDEIYILDFSYSKEILEELNNKVGLLKILDHHKTAQEDLKDLPYAKFDMGKSGAVLAWEYFHPGVEIPEILLDIQDGDLWKFERSTTESIRAALPLLEYKVEWLDEVSMLRDDYFDFANKGAAIVELENIEINNRVPRKVHGVNLFGYSCGCINCTTLISKTGAKICEDPHFDIAMMYQVIENGEVLLSFRAAKNSAVDVSEIARKFGGGGHAKAAGGKCTLVALQHILGNDYTTS